MISRALFIFTIVICITSYQTASPDESLAYIILGSLAGAALMKPRGKVKE